MDTLFVLIAIVFVCTIACGAYIVTRVINHNFQELFKRLDKPAVMPQVVKKKPTSPQETEPKKESSSNKTTKKKETMSFKEMSEKDAITKALKKHDGNIKKAAEYMRIPYQTFYKKIKRYNLNQYIKRGNPQETRFSNIAKKYIALRENGKLPTEAAKELKISVNAALNCEGLYYNKLKYEIDSNH